MKKAIICFTRVPIPGKTKTRLMPVLGGETCAQLHTAFLQDVADACEKMDADLFVAYTPEGKQEILKGIFPRAKDGFAQQGEELGARMHHALEKVLALGYDACVLIGSDLPLLHPAHLEGAFSALECADVTLGPTPDGGYYLVGMKRPCPELFEKQAYSVSSVYENAVRAAEAVGRSFRPAPLCSDVDTPEDLAELRKELAGQNTHTARCLAAIFDDGGSL